MSRAAMGCDCHERLHAGARRARWCRIYAVAAELPWHVVGCSIPGVLFGSTIGSRVGRYLPGPVMENGLGVVLGLVGGLVLALEWLS